MADNVLGTVQIVITGDTSQLQASFARAEGMAAASGQVVARGFAQGADGADKIVVAIGRLAGVIQAENAAMSLSFQRNIATLAGFGAAANGVVAPIRSVGNAAAGTVPQMAAVSGAIRTAFGEQSIRAVERFLTLIPGVGQLLQVAFPIIGAVALYEAFERATSRSEQLKEALKEQASQAEATDKADKELAETIDKIGVRQVGARAGAAAEAAAEAQRLAAEAKAVSGDIGAIESKIRGLRASVKDNDRWVLGGPSAKEIDAQVAAEEEKINQLLTKQQGLYAQAGAAAVEAGQKASEQGGSLAAISAKGHEKTGTDAAEAALAAAKRQIAAAHDVRQARIDSEQDAGTKEIESAAERTRVAQETASAEVTAARAVTAAKIEGINAVSAAEAQGKASPEQKKIQATRGIDVSAAQREGLEKEKAAVADAYAVENKEGEAYTNAQRGWVEDLARAWGQAEEKKQQATRKTADQAFIAANAPAAYNQLAVQGAQGVIDKGAGQQKELQIEGQKIALEAAYGQQIVKTGADRVAYLQQIAALEQAANTAKLTGLAADLRDAEVNATNLKGQEGYIAALKKVAELKVQIAGIGQQGINQQIQAQGQVTGAENANDPLYQVGTDIKNAFQKLPGELGSALANALFDHRKGDSTGKQVGEAFKNAGKQLVGSLLTTALKDLGEKIVAETGIQTLFNGIFQTGTAAQTVATTANTAAVVANTAAQAASAGAGAAGGIASAAGGVAGAAGSAGAAAATGGLSELAPIIGGVISGVISAVATVWGDAKIIQAIDATTAAVNGLRQFLASGSQGYSTSGEAGGPTTSEGTFANAEKSASDAGGALSQIPYVAGILGSFGLGNGMPVRIVGIDPGVISGFVLGNSLVGGLGGILGFDKGGPVPNDMIAQVHGGEWVLTKDQVAGRAPLPTELTGKGLSSAGLPSRLSLPSAQPSGSTPAGSGGHTVNGPMNFYGVQNVRQMMRQIADVAKSASPGFSPYSR